MGELSGICPRSKLGVLLALRWEQCEGRAQGGTSEARVPR